LIVIDDLPWLDEPSLAVLGYVLRRVAPAPVGLLATARITGAEQPDHDVIANLSDSTTTRLALGPLSVQALAEVLSDRLRLTLPRRVLTRVHEATGGNPLYAIEYGKTLTGETAQPERPDLSMPASLRLLIGQSVGDLPLRTREMLLAVALMAEPTVT